MSKDLEKEQPHAYIYATALPINPNDDVAPDHIVKCYQLSKTVMLFAMIDTFFGLFYMFYSFFYSIVNI